MLGPNFTFGVNEAKKYGVHEIVIEASEVKGNPFDTNCTVEFVSPSGEKIIVNAFYDGGIIWRARLYVNEEGEWDWRSYCLEVPELNGHCGKFNSKNSNLRGMLRRCPDNPRQWITDNGKWFINISDSAYPLFHPKETMWKEYIQDLAQYGMTSTRCDSLGGDTWDEGWDEATVGDKRVIVDDPSYLHEYNFWPWDKKDMNRLDLKRFQTTDERLEWMLNNYPDIYVQLILIGVPNVNDFDTRGKMWNELPEKSRQNLMRHMIARWAAFPQLFWQVTHDTLCSEECPNTQTFMREVGHYFAANDPWQHLLSTGPCRYADFPFITAEDMKWVSYIYIEDSAALDADVIDKYAGYPFHVFLGEDRYEQYLCQSSSGSKYYVYNPQYYYRWLFWSWLLSGGSANYAGRWATIHPYSKTGSIIYWEPDGDKMVDYHDELKGLHSVRYIKDFFENRAISLDKFIPDHSIVADADRREKNGYIKLMRRGFEEFVIYHPNACRAGTGALIDENRYASFHIEFALNRFLGKPVIYDMEWFRPSDGESLKDRQISGNDRIKLIAPWKGTDVVLHLKKRI